MLLSPRAEARCLAAPTEQEKKAVFWVSWDAPAQQAANMLFGFETLPFSVLWFCFLEELEVTAMSSWSKITR